MLISIYDFIFFSSKLFITFSLYSCTFEYEAWKLFAHGMLLPLYTNIPVDGARLFTSECIDLRIPMLYNAKSGKTENPLPYIYCNLSNLVSKISQKNYWLNCRQISQASVLINKLGSDLQILCRS